ncbi:hypothetical protein B7P43_G07722 [Cryptotermes secundus]|uniref:Glycosyl hydrolases family 39 N-terminal catalytic domain-containing protein n=1 Tax=Cryptotermes secundus TaxID=105785 RepID=A0A2J7Q4H4_9NEOP|nr:hypothetical protein B7P43_G07722 [Cryptotermes secundus]
MGNSRFMCLLLESAAISWSLPIVIVWAEPRVTVDVAKPSIGELQHFWDSTGLCPSAPNFLLAKDERFNLALIGSLPHQSISQVRIHWLLDLITVSSVDESGTPYYNFTFLDQWIDWLQLYRLNPGFELMGNPSHLFSDFSNSTQAKMWRHLVREVASRYIGRYGLAAVAQWRFETWNEPDLKSYNILNFTLQSYLQYFEACSAGLQDAAQGILRLGGPAGLFKTWEKHPLCWGLLQHCTNQTACSLNFISFHKKGGGSGSAILEQGLELAHNISIMYPSLRRIPLANEFQMNNTNPPHVQFFKKPVYTAMALLSLLGNQELQAAVRMPDDRLSVLAAGSNRQDAWTRSVLLVFSNNTASQPDERMNVMLRVLSVQGASPRYTLYLLDDTLTNPAQVWLNAGAPVFPEQQLRAQLRAVEGPHRVRGPTSVPTLEKLRLLVPLKLPSVALLHICSKPTEAPGQVGT